ncbi:21834_t:CDS:2, partial [Gigaspora margarita]
AYKTTLEKILADGTKTGNKAKLESKKEKEEIIGGNKLEDDTIATNKSGKKATWFQGIENIILANTYTRKVKEEFKIQEQNVLALMPQLTKRAHFIDIVCYESNSKGKSQIGERSSNRVLQEKLSNRVKRTQTEKLIDISPWVKYAKREMNLELEPDHFINKSKRSSISLEIVRNRIVEGQEKRRELKKALVRNWEEGTLWFYTDGLCKVVDNRKVLGYRVVQIDRERK